MTTSNRRGAVNAATLVGLALIVLGVLALATYTVLVLAGGVVSVVVGARRP